jgi:hypothetical protein
MFAIRFLRARRQREKLWPTSPGANRNSLSPSQVTRLSRNHAGFPLILSERSRKTGVFAAGALAQIS